MDTYLRLDRDLEQLFAAVDRGPGMDRTLVYLAATPPECVAEGVAREMVGQMCVCLGGAERRPAHGVEADGEGTQAGAAMGNYTDETYSPAALAVSTIADEARIAGGGVTAVYAIAADFSTRSALLRPNV